MAKILFLLSIMTSVQVFAITRVVNCRDGQTQNLELQVVLRGGVATLNVCPGDVCGENDLRYAQTLLLQDDGSQTLHYVRSSGQALPVRQSLDIEFGDEGKATVSLFIDQADSGFNCY